MHANRHSSRSLVFLAASLIVSGAARAADDREPALLAVLHSDAPAAEKAVTCKLLAIHGSSAAVADLARLLPDPQLSSWARIALEAIPGAAADEALRQAIDTLQGELLVGAINSIGVRQDANAVNRLTKSLGDRDSEVASAAAVALGKIGNEAASRALRDSLTDAPPKVRSAVAEGCVLCAERFLAAGNAAEAVAIYDQIRGAKLPRQRVLEATRGAVLARGDEGIPLLLEQFRSPDKWRFQLALSTAREFPGRAVDQALAAELDRSPPERAAWLIHAMADRPETVVLPAVLRAAEKGPDPVRLAAVAALGRVGDASCLAVLLETAVRSVPAPAVIVTPPQGEAPVAEVDALRAAARAALAELPGEKVNAEIVSRLADSKRETLPLLLELVGHRRIDAVPALLKALEHADAPVRRAALTALGETVALPQLSVLVSKVVSPAHPADAAIAQQALKAASVRMPDREACAAELAGAIATTEDVATKGALLEALGDVGGTRALAAMDAAANSSDAELQDVSTRLLGQWMTADAAPVLLKLAKSGPAGKYQVRALRGYIRIARQFILPERERSEMCRQAMEAARQPAEQKLVLEVLQRYPNAENLKLASSFMQVPELQSEAAQAALTIAQKLGAKGVDVRELLAAAGLPKVALEIVKAEYGAGTTFRDVTAVVKKHAGDLLLITLPSPSYNAAFGGDPLPGSVKRLKIQYRMNGQAGEASFAENALIILPLLK